jgi:predicted ferric reductase
MSSQTQSQSGSLAAVALTAAKIALVVGLGLTAVVTLTLVPVVPWLKEALASFGAKTAWYLSRSMGIIAYLLMSASVMWGLVLSSKIVKEVAPPPAALAVHNAISWAGIGLGLLHALALLFDTYYTYTLFDVLMPFVGPYRPGWVGLGTVSLYAMIIVSMSFAWRKWLGQTGWRIIHYTSFFFYAVLTVHGLMAGTDSASAAIRLLYVVSVLGTLFLLNYRLLAAKKARGRAN